MSYPATDPLTARQRRAITLLGHGYTRAEVAEQMGVSLASVHQYMAQAADKVGSRGSVSHMILFAWKFGLINPAEVHWPPNGVPLTARQRRAITLLAHGYTPSEVAEQMGVSLASVRQHMRQAADKVGSRGSVSHMILFAWKFGLINPAEVHWPPNGGAKGARTAPG